MKTMIAMTHALLLGATLAVALTAMADAPTAAKPHRYLIERTFPAGALKGLDTATKQKVNANNKSVGVRWIQSFSNADETKTYCLYEGPSEEAVRKAAELNKLPVDKITEVPVTLLPR